jgi:integration host factor subunit beta
MITRDNTQYRKSLCNKDLRLRRKSVESGNRAHSIAGNPSSVGTSSESFNLTSMDCPNTVETTKTGEDFGSERATSAHQMRPWSSGVTKKEIVKTISEEIGLTQLKTKEIVQKTFDAIVEALVAEGRIELRNFGVFEVKPRAARKARNPRTGDKVLVPAKNVVTFKPGKEMEERVRQMQIREEHDEVDLDANSKAPPTPKPTTDSFPQAGPPGS